MRRVLLACGTTLAIACLSTTGLQAAEYFVPKGHTYSPNNEKLPRLNSERDRIQARTDELEARIYRQQLEQRRFIEQMNSFEDHVFGERDRRWNNW